jgi:hypothetical protein
MRSLSRYDWGSIEPKHYTGICRRSNGLILVEFSDPFSDREGSLQACRLAGEPLNTRMILNPKYGS